MNQLQDHFFYQDKYKPMNNDYLFDADYKSIVRKWTTIGDIERLQKKEEEEKEDNLNFHLLKKKPTLWERIKQFILE